MKIVNAGFNHTHDSDFNIDRPDGSGDNLLILLRSDAVFNIDGRDVRVFGSQGQQRTAALSLKLAEIELVKRIINDDPVLLLDDVMSELDTKRRNALLESLKGIQTIITCTGYDDFIRERISIDRIYRVEKGTVREVRNGTE